MRRESIRNLLVVAGVHAHTNSARSRSIVAWSVSRSRSKLVLANVLIKVETAAIGRSGKGSGRDVSIVKSTSTTAHIDTQGQVRVGSDPLANAEVLHGAVGAVVSLDERRGESGLVGEPSRTARGVRGASRRASNTNGGCLEIARPHTNRRSPVDLNGGQVLVGRRLVLVLAPTAVVARGRHGSSNNGAKRRAKGLGKTGRIVRHRLRHSRHAWLPLELRDLGLCLSELHPETKDFIIARRALAQGGTSGASGGLGRWEVFEGRGYRHRGAGGPVVARADEDLVVVFILDHGQLLLVQGLSLFIKLRKKELHGAWLKGWDVLLVVCNLE